MAEEMSSPTQLWPYQGQEQEVRRELSKVHLFLNALPRETTATAKVKQVAGLVRQTQQLKGPLSHFGLQMQYVQSVKMYVKSYLDIHHSGVVCVFLGLCLIVEDLWWSAMLRPRHDAALVFDTRYNI